MVERLVVGDVEEAEESEGDDRTELAEETC